MIDKLINIANIENRPYISNLTAVIASKDFNRFNKIYLKKLSYIDNKSPAIVNIKNEKFALYFNENIYSIENKILKKDAINFQDDIKSFAFLSWKTTNSKYDLFGTWNIVDRDGYKCLYPNNDIQIGDEFKVIDENNTELKHFKYSGLEEQMLDASMKEDVGLFGRSIILLVPNCNNSKSHYTLGQDTFSICTKNSTDINDIIELEFIEKGTLNGIEKTLEITTPNTDSKIKYNLNFEHFGGAAPNSFEVIDSDGNIVKTIGSLDLDQETTFFNITFEFSGNTNFKIKITGLNDPDTEDLYEITGKLTYHQTY